jgi:hypothetical protein
MTNRSNDLSGTKPAMFHVSKAERGRAGTELSLWPSTAEPKTGHSRSRLLSRVSLWTAITEGKAYQLMDLFLPKVRGKCRLTSMEKSLTTSNTNARFIEKFTMSAFVISNHRSRNTKSFATHGAVRNETLS